MSFVADRRLYLTRDKDRVVEEGDRAAAYLLVGVGQWIPTDQVARYGLSHDADGRVVLPGTKRAAEPENKMIVAAEDKAAAAPAPAADADAASDSPEPDPVQSQAPRRYGKRGRPTPPKE